MTERELTPANILHRQGGVVDLHIHPAMTQVLFQRDLRLRQKVMPSFSVSSVRASYPRMKAGSYRVALSVAHAPEKGLQEDFWYLKALKYLRWRTWSKIIDRPSFDVTNTILDEVEAMADTSTARTSVLVAKSIREMDAALDAPERPLVLIHAVEGAHSLGDPDDKTIDDAQVHRNLEAFFKRGVAYLTLAHFYPNRVAHPCFPFPEDFARLSTNPNIWRDLTNGLTPLGKDIVRRMIDMGMLIDLSHCTPQARKDVFEIADASGKHPPLMMTHVGAYEVNPSPYNPRDDEIRRIARDGGIIGVIFMNYWTMPRESGQGLHFISRTIQHLIEIGSEDCVGVGTDFDGFTDPPDDLQDASQMKRLTERLQVDSLGWGLSECDTVQRIRKILADNALRVLREGWGKKD
jgi:microsomal dipeptidase-like Zn-dependent dipeptidase